MPIAIEISDLLINLQCIKVINVKNYSYKALNKITLVKAKSSYMNHYSTFV
jgi:hypothetical protein